MATPTGVQSVGGTATPRCRHLAVRTRDRRTGRLETHEVIYLVAGSMTVTPDGGEASVDQASADMAVFPKGWTGTWDIHETVRKVYLDLLARGFARGNFFYKKKKTPARRRPPNACPPKRSRGSPRPRLVRRPDRWPGRENATMASRQVSRDVPRVAHHANRRAAAGCEGHRADSTGKKVCQRHRAGRQVFDAIGE